MQTSPHRANVEGAGIWMIKVFAGLFILVLLGVHFVVNHLVAPGGLPAPASLLRFDLLVMIAVAIACLPVFASGATIARWEGALFLFYYVAYTAYLVLASQQHDALPVFSTVMEVFVLPLTGITLVVVGWRAWKRPAG